MRPDCLYHFRGPRRGSEYEYIGGYDFRHGGERGQRKFYECGGLYVTPEQLAARAHGVERQEAAKAHKREKGKQPIAEQLKAAQREAQADRGQDIPKRSAPDRGER